MALSNLTIQAVLTYSILFGAVLLTVFRTIAVLRNKKEQPGCNSGCPSCEAKNLTKELISKGSAPKAVK
jgi:hypothetical protein